MFDICRNQFHLPQNGGKGLKLVSKMLWRNGTWISVWNIPLGKTGLPFHMFFCSQKFSTGTTQKSWVPFTFQLDFPEMFCTWYTTIATLIKTYIHLDLSFQLLKHIWFFSPIHFFCSFAPYAQISLTIQTFHLWYQLVPCHLWKHQW